MMAGGMGVAGDELSADRANWPASFDEARRIHYSRGAIYGGVLWRMRYTDARLSPLQEAMR